jgi:hypothetical protein
VPPMSFLTVEVEIDHGRISPKGTERLPVKAVGLFTILSPERTDMGDSNPDQQRPCGLARGLFHVSDSFNEALPSDLLRMFEGQ